jgi:hypothetical protein
MPPAPPIGAEYTYSPPHGNAFGHQHKGSELSAEMTEVDTGRVIVEWTDDKELPRMTSIDPQEFNTDFKKVS